MAGYLPMPAVFWRRPLLPEKLLRSRVDRMNFAAWAVGGAEEAAEDRVPSAGHVFIVAPGEPETTAER